MATVTLTKSDYNKLITMVNTLSDRYSAVTRELAQVITDKERAESMKYVTINDYLLEVVQAGYQLSDPNRPEIIIPITEVFCRPKSSSKSSKSRRPKTARD